MPRVVHSGFCKKEGGVFKNWKKRWFTLVVDREDGVNRSYIRYFRDKGDNIEAGRIPVDISSKLSILGKDIKGKDNLFAIGPADPSATHVRTFFIQCETPDEVFTWCEKYNEALEFITSEEIDDSFEEDEVEKSDAVVVDLEALTPNNRITSFSKLIRFSISNDWGERVFKDGISVQRLKGKRLFFKITTIVPSAPSTFLNFARDVTAPGSKFDYVFRNAEKIADLSEFPPARVSFAQHNIPIVGVKTRDVCFLDSWVTAPTDGHVGLLIESVECGSRPVQKHKLIDIQPSGILIRPIAAVEVPESVRKMFPESQSQFSEAQILIDADVQGSLQRLIRMAYKTGILKIAFRNILKQVLSTYLSSLGMKR
eukprot:TRINITY_DN2375_c0_g1_i1.p1 TRINITY_DN2375_c0_g1~~TRINITY_DN2375_c0_g1_i1.p1  ORF type:complete len:369 (-),score=83.93 TRINITY_DN2375_c0_g1_i1:333-1439(-)